MAYWIEFYKPNLNGDLAPALGSDGFQRCDGRASLRTAIKEGKIRARNLRAVQPHYEAFMIHSGATPSSARPYTHLIPLDL